MTTKTVTFQLPLDLYDMLKYLAKQERKEPKEVMEQLITLAYEQRLQTTTTSAFQTILEHAANLGVSDLAVHHDDYLYGTDKR
jgi:hypothetical protein